MSFCDCITLSATLDVKGNRGIGILEEARGHQFRPSPCAGEGPRTRWAPKAEREGGRAVVSIDSPKVKARAALLWAVAFMLLASLFTAAAHNAQTDDHTAASCVICIFASHLDLGNTSSVSVFTGQQSSVPAEPVVLSRLNVGVPPRVQPRAPPL